MSGNFYRAFEDRHRGPRALIKQRLRVYEPFLQSLKETDEACPALDIGCGRGEWLELLIEQGFQAKGVDLDEGMLQACRDSGLPAVQGDALSALQALPAESQSLISGFHIVEHIPFSVLQELVSEALRVLKPGGLLILETPNAENLVVGTNSFYLDPTHERPLPHQLLEFLVEYSGFARQKILRLQEAPQVRETDQLQLLDVLGGSSPDYAVVAQKHADKDRYEVLTPAFEKDFGVSLGTLAQRYEQQLQHRFWESRTELQAVRGEIHVLSQQLHDASRLSSILAEPVALLSRELEAAQSARRQADEQRQHADQQRQHTEDARQQAHRELESLRQELQAAHQSAHHWHIQADALQGQNNALLSSTSWRLTAPLRLISSRAGQLRQGARPSPVALARRVLKLGIRPLLKYPWFVRRLNVLVARYPGLAKRMRDDRQAVVVERATTAPLQSMPTDAAGLSARSKKLYAAFVKQDMENRP